MNDRLIAEIAQNTGIDDDVVIHVANELMLQLHRRLFEYRGLNGDFIGEELHLQIGPQAFYHLLGFLDLFSDRYQWERGSATEYLLRLGRRADWAPFQHQMEGWRDARTASSPEDNRPG
jgi:hypothetical protein